MFGSELFWLTHHDRSPVHGLVALQKPLQDDRKFSTLFNQGQCCRCAFLSLEFIKQPSRSMSDAGAHFKDPSRSKSTNGIP